MNSAIIRALIPLFISVLLGFGCGKKDAASGNTDSTGTDSTSLAAVEGSMEGDAENFGQRNGGTAEADSTAKPKRERAVNVNASGAVRGDLVRPVVAEGYIRARHSAEIHAEVAGKLIRVLVEEGQAVRRGQLIVKLDDREYEMAAEESRARYLQALSLLTIEDSEIDSALVESAQATRDEFADLERLERTGKITRDERLAREIAMDIRALKDGKFRGEIAAARSGVSVARADLERARLNLERTEIRAPFDGIVSGLTLTAGEQIMLNQTICTLVDNVNIEAEVGVLEADVGKIAPGGFALLAVPALGDTFKVTVDVVSPQFDRATRTCQVLLRVKNEDGRLRPGMFARSLIAGERFDDRLLVPREAILFRDDRPLLFKVEGDRAKWLYVDVGENNDHLIEIRSVLQGGTLDPGDRVVVSDHLTLAHDAKIKVRRTLPLTDPWLQSGQGE
ncbi:MAG: efflux RND transporter periplasmic adaptor subunit [Candidatus Krumholzibacteria bacterium]|nr:efflux RND transporter periplasmic adaptor subunit [Candidatus Krumholzibacteria bacterium]MDH4337811.1 efflux RND transporter periplasmic adaptor subunit [Candidatus Krumholzibacteria bacterium]MDH5271183.1 efflux RND transporter periplasmic adaptor subunit [Candidatus Krumholzibacteria bacterium]